MTEQRQRLLRRLSAGLIGGGVLAGLLMLGVLPLWDAWQDTNDSIERSTRLLAGYQRVIDDAPATSRRLYILQRQDAGLGGLVAGPTSALAVASLQTDLKQIVESHGGKIQSMQPGAVTQSHGFDRLEVKIDLFVPGDAFADLITALDSHQPALSIDPLELQVADGGSQTDRLTIRMTVSAYHRSIVS